MHRWKTLAGFGVAVVAVGLSLSACSALGYGEAAAADAPASAAAAADSLPDVLPPSIKPELPDAATQPTEEGATAFVRFWFDALNYSLAVGDKDLLASYTSIGCGQCSGWLMGIATWQGEGATLQGGLTGLLDLAIAPFDIAQPVQFAATFVTSPASLIDAAGEVTEYPGGVTQGAIAVVWESDRWQMTDVVLSTGSGG